ncbi:unnamed protein product [Bemisia tabaci]|uniref:Glycoprotein n=1 Tax=Bemisia tabaci TaxID=7038 RepID=A0A9P0ADI0_BEMTA|nr:unnamed protein product [Bemisia tabaci]
MFKFSLFAIVFASIRITQSHPIIPNTDSMTQGDDTKPVQNSGRLIGYDCRGIDSSFTSISLLSEHTCQKHPYKVEPTIVLVQLLQLSSSFEIPYIQCYVQKTPFVKGCGKLADYTWSYKGGFKEEIVSLSKVQCENLHKTRMYDLEGDRKLKIGDEDVEYTGHYIAAGSLNARGDCSGASYSFNGYEYDDAVAEVHLKVRISSGSARYVKETGKISLESGYEAVYSSGSIMDVMNGVTYWDQTIKGECDDPETNLNVLFTGPANLIVGANSSLSMVTVESGNTAFSIEIKRSQFVCGFDLKSTEHPQLFAFITESLNSPTPVKTSAALDPKAIDLSLYMNTKFVYIERHIGVEIDRMYQDLVYQRCKIEAKTIQNLLTLSLISPEEFAYASMEDSGYTAVVNGEVAHIIKCQPIPVVFNSNPTRCFKEIPVLYGANKTGYLSPRNRVVQDYGSEMPCHPLLSTMFKVGGIWLSVYPRPMQAKEPRHLSLTIDSFVYQGIKDLAQLEIYSTDQLLEYQRSLLFQKEKKAISSNVASQFAGIDIDSSNLHTTNLLNPEELESVATGAVHKVFGFTSKWGGLFSTIFVFTALYRVVMNLLNSIVNVVSLYEVFGFSKHLFFCFWDSLTHFFVIRAHVRNRDNLRAARPENDQQPQDSAHNSNNRRQERYSTDENQSESIPLRGRILVTSENVLKQIDPVFTLV